MTEQEWLECTNPLKMLEFLRGKASDRKSRLFVLACCHRVSLLLQGEESQKAMSAVERYAAGAIKPTTLRKYLRLLGDTRRRCVKPYSAHWYASLAVEHALARGPAPSPDQCCHFVATALATSPGQAYGGKSWTAKRTAEDSTICRLLRDLFGPLPFRPVTLDPSWRTWNAGLLMSMARRMYDSRDFRDMPVLADALEEAGCQELDVLRHCREPGEHVRGCWVVDLLLGKS